MPKPLTWDNPEDIGILLSETHPELDPLTVRFTDLHRYVTELPGFAGDPKPSNECKLEAIQMAPYAGLNWAARLRSFQWSDSPLSFRHNRKGLTHAQATLPMDWILSAFFGRK